MLYSQNKLEVVPVHEIEYYVENSKCPVLEFIRENSSKEQAKILREIDLLQEFGFTLGMPHIKKIQGTDDLWELRIRHSSNSFRIFYFCFLGGRFVLLHGIRKTTNKTPKRDIELSLERIEKYLKRV